MDDDNCFGRWKSCMTTIAWQRSWSLAWRLKYSVVNRSFSLHNTWHCPKTEPNRFFSSRFCVSNRFTCTVRFSRCFFFLQRDLLADSRFDIIRLRFLSSTEKITRFEFEFEPSEPEFGLWMGNSNRDKSSSISGAVNPVSGRGYWSWTGSCANNMVTTRVKWKWANQPAVNHFLSMRTRGRKGEEKGKEEVWERSIYREDENWQ